MRLTPGILNFFHAQQGNTCWSLQFGAWAGAGMAGFVLGSKLERSGLLLVTPPLGLRVLGECHTNYCGPCLCMLQLEAARNKGCSLLQPSNWMPARGADALVISLVETSCACTTGLTLGEAAVSSHRVPASLVVSGFFWERVAKPAQHQWHFFQDVLSGVVATPSVKAQLTYTILSRNAAGHRAIF